MVCNDHETVVKALKNRLSAVVVGPYRLEYVNDASPYRGIKSEHIAVLERSGEVIDTVDIRSEYVRSLVEYYGASGIEEQY